MSTGARLNGLITQLAVGRHLPLRTVRVRLTLLYGGLFLFSGAALMAIAYALLVNAGFVFTLQSGAPPDRGTTTTVVAGPALRLGSPTHPTTQTLIHWRGVARCMRTHGVAAFPDPRSSFPQNLRGIRMVSDRDGAIIAIPAGIDLQSRAFMQANAACGFQVPDRSTLSADDRRRAQVRRGLVIRSAIALAGMSLLSLLLGWVMAGRVLRPLEDSYEAQRRFVASASHELRAPLTRQRALIEVALADPDADLDSLRAAHERVLAAERHLEQIIDGLLALTRSQAGLERRENLDVAVLASEAMDARGAQLDDVKLDVRVMLAPAPASGDPRLIERLIGNLIDNAIRHNTSGGYVEITSGIRHQRAFLTVANSGLPIPPKELPRLVEPFERLGVARTHHDKGHGLGLSIVRAIADAHRAELSVRARAHGGLAVEISFPPATRSAPKLTLPAANPQLDTPRATLQD